MLHRIALAAGKAHALVRTPGARTPGAEGMAGTEEKRCFSMVANSAEMDYHQGSPEVKAGAGKQRAFTEVFWVLGTSRCNRGVLSFSGSYGRRVSIFKEAVETSSP